MKNKVFLGNLPWSAREAQVKELLRERGVSDYESAEVVVDRQTDRSRGIGFVRFATEEAAERAVEKLFGSEVGGRLLVVEVATSPDRPRGGSRGDPGGDRGRSERGRVGRRGRGGEYDDEWR